jgi:hypothetical protein
MNAFTDLNFYARNAPFFNIARIVIAFLIQSCFLFTLVAITMKQYKFLFASGGIFFIICAAYIAIYTLFLYINFNQLPVKSKHVFIIEFSLKATTIAICSILSFLLAATFRTNSSGEATKNGRDIYKRATFDLEISLPTDFTSETRVFLDSQPAESKC